MTKRISPLVTGLAAVLAGAGPTMAQPVEMSLAATPKAAVDYTLVTRYGTDYQEYITRSCGSNFYNCIATFATLTRNIRFTRISCAGRSSNAPISLSLVNDGASPIPPMGAIMLPVAPTTYATQVFTTKYIYYTNINQEINVVMRKGTAPYVNFYNSGSNPYETISIACTLTGTIL